MNLGSIKQIKTRLTGQWEKGRFLKALASEEDLFPFEIVIKGPSSTEMIDDFDTVRTWIRDVRTGCEKSKLQLVLKEINHRQLGRNFIPYKIIFSDITELSGFLGKKTELRIFQEGLFRLGESFPELVSWALQYPFELINKITDLDRLVSVVRWRLQHPRPGIFLRQLSLPGVDTKFIESHRKLLGQWMDILLDKGQINEQFSGIGKFEQRYGFLQKPEMVRFRLTDPELKIGSFSDLSVRADEFALMELPVRYIFIIENDITALSFPPVKESLIIFGRGYNFDHLVQALWLKGKELWYWGDIDTHGFAILNQFRTCFPTVNSFLMDRETLMSHRVHWGKEKTPVNAGLLKLSREELHLYDDLRSNIIEENLRLEQEFISYSRVLEVVGSIIK